MGIVAICPNGHRIKVKDALAGRKGICPTCAARFRIPLKDVASPADHEAHAGGIATARVVSLDPLFAASLPTAHALAEADTIDASGPATEGGPAEVEFVELAEEPVGTEADATAAPGRPPAFPALEERQDPAWRIAVRGGAPSEPLSAAALQAWLASGAASADHVVWQEGWPDWRALAEVFPEALPPAPRGWP